jgi:very-short-patch-repair endonuclease
MDAVINFTSLPIFWNFIKTSRQRFAQTGKTHLASCFPPSLLVRELRKNSTDAEKHLWHFLRAKRLKGYKFRRQHLLYPFVVDFICLEKKLVVELDGGQHAEQRHYDENRTLYLQSKGYRVLRFWNNEIFQETEAVLSEILYNLNKDG